MSDITTGYVFVDGERGVTAQKENDQVNLAVINPAFVSAKPTTSVVDNADQLLILKAAGTYAKAPFSTVSTSVAGQLALADATTNGMLKKVSGVASDVVDGTNNCRPIASVITQAARGYNAIGNPNFEVDQRNVGGVVTNPASLTFIQDRWFVQKGGLTTANVSYQQSAGTIVSPGTNFQITAKYLFINLAAQQASLATGAFYTISQVVEGPFLRELVNDVHSLQVLISSSVAPVKLGLSLSNPAGTWTLAELVTIPTANTWTLVPFPNIPKFTTSGGWNVNPGNSGYIVSLCLAAGATFTSTSNNAWLNANYLGSLGQDNWFANPIGTNISLAFVQHEPGPVCTSLIDIPFSRNLYECQRYLCKSYDYGTAIGANTFTGVEQWITWPNGTSGYSKAKFPVTMAKEPTITVYKHDGTVNNVYSLVDGLSRPLTAITASDNGINQINFTGVVSTTAIQGHIGQYVADTGW